MNTLPTVLLNEIWNMYWYDIYKITVIDEIKQLNKMLNKINTFMINHFYKNTSELYDKQISYYLKYYNKELRKIRNNKGYYLLCQFNNSKINYCFNKSLHSHSRVNDKYQFIAIYSIMFGIPYMRYQYWYRFEELQ